MKGRVRDVTNPIPFNVRKKLWRCLFCGLVSSKQVRLLRLLDGGQGRGDPKGRKPWRQFTGGG
jgi:hypothetical protein